MKILKLNGLKYSRNEFDGYKLRGKMKLVTIDGEDFNVNIYTTDINKANVVRVLASRTSDKVHSFEFVHWATKEQDDATTDFLNDFFDK